MTVFESIRQQLNIVDVAEYYGVDVRRGNMARCIDDSHDDKTPSMKLYSDNFYCFGCGCNGDVTDLTSKLFNLDKLEAAKKLARDFNLSVDFEVGQKDNYEYVPRISRREIEENTVNTAYRLIFDYRNFLKEYRENHKPQNRNQPLHPLFVESLNLDKYEYYCEVFLSYSREKQLQFVYDNLLMLSQIKERMEGDSIGEKQSPIADKVGQHSQRTSKINQINNKEKIKMEMNIKATVFPVENESQIKGNAIVSINDQFAIHNVLVYESRKTGELEVGMPCQMKNGEYKDIAFPVTKEAQSQIKEAVLEAYHAALAQVEKEQSALEPANIDVKVSGVRGNNYDNNINADCQVTINDAFVITGVKVITAIETGELTIALPSEQGSDGEYRGVVRPMSTEAFAQLKEAVLKQYLEYEQNKENIIGNTAYKNIGGKGEIKHSSLNNKFAEKVGEQLNADNVKWSGKISGDKTIIAVNKNDESALKVAVNKARESSKDKGKILNAIKEKQAANKEKTPSTRDKSANKSKNEAEL